SAPFRSVIRAPGDANATASGNGTRGAWLTAASMGQTLLVTLEVGTPPQPLNVMLDTGSFTFWVRSTRCYLGNACRTSAAQYNPLRSSTFRNSTAVEIERTYGDGTRVRCEINEDRLTFAGITVPNQKVCVVTGLQTSTSAREDGLLGLGPPQTRDPVEVFPNLRGSFPASAVSFWYDRNVNSLDVATGIVPNGGEVAFGLPDPARFTGEWSWLPIDQSTKHWAVTMDSVVVDGRTVPVEAADATTIMDTGTTLIILPYNVFRVINNRMGGKSAGGNGVYTLDCKTVRSLPPVTFNLNGKPFTLTWDMQFYVVREYCVSAFGTVPNLPAILGVAFLRHFYTTFDYDNARVGLATPTGNNPVPKLPSGSGAADLHSMGFVSAAAGAAAAAAAAALGMSL
ncbi:aspartic peptidase domain-containing protein, partial [Entophlyctis helioformis]